MKNYNLTGLISEINKVIPKPLNWSTSMKKTWDGREYPYIETDNFVDQCGLLSDTLKSAKLRTFNANDMDSDDCIYWMTINVEVEFKDYGSNGWDYIEAYQLNNGNWTVKKR